VLRGAFLVAAVAFFVSAAGVHAATSVAVVPAAFSPRLAQATISVQLDAPRKLGIALVSAGGRRLGWISRPHVRRAVRVTWSGRLHGVSVPDGSYRVVARANRRGVASASVVVDSTAPLLRRLHLETKSYPFAGDGRLVKTVSPNGDGLRDFAFVRFRLSEPATVMLQVFRTRKKLIGPIWEPRSPSRPASARSRGRRIVRRRRGSTCSDWSPSIRSATGASTGARARARRPFRGAR
jgi:hypothetical protein